MTVPLLFVLSACGARGPAPQDGGRGAGGSGSAADRVAEARAGEATAGKATAAPLREERPIAERRGRLNDAAVTLALLPLRRRGPTVGFQMVLTTRVQDAGTVYAAFDDGALQRQSDPDDISPREGFTLDGIMLIDGVHGRLYRVARDRFHKCVCDEVTHAELGRGTPLRLSARFGAPPPDVTAVDVVVPHFGTFSDVPLG